MAEVPSTVDQLLELFQGRVAEDQLVAAVKSLVEWAKTKPATITIVGTVAGYTGIAVSGDPSVSVVQDLLVEALQEVGKLKGASASPAAASKPG